MKPHRTFYLNRHALIKLVAVFNNETNMHVLPCNYILMACTLKGNGDIWAEIGNARPIFRPHLISKRWCSDLIWYSNLRAATLPLLLLLFPRFVHYIFLMNKWNCTSNGRQMGTVTVTVIVTRNYYRKKQIHRKLKIKCVIRFSLRWQFYKHLFIKFL